jgi:hypothetical protein
MNISIIRTARSVSIRTNEISIVTIRTNEISIVTCTGMNEASSQIIY